MKTFEKIFITLALLSTLLVKSQQIDWNRINSQTVIDMINLQNADHSLSTSSVSQVVQMGDFNNADLQINSKTNIMVAAIRRSKQYLF